MSMHEVAAGEIVNPFGDIVTFGDDIIQWGDIMLNWVQAHRARKYGWHIIGPCPTHNPELVICRRLMRDRQRLYRG